MTRRKESPGERGPCVDRWGPSQHPGLHSTLLLIYRRGEGACLGVYRRFSGTDSFSIRAGRTAHPQQQALCLRSAQRLTLNLNLQLQAHPAHSNLILCPTSLEQGEPETEETRGRPGGGEAPRTAGRDEGLWDTESPQKREGWDKGRGLRGVLGRGPGQETQFQGRRGGPKKGWGGGSRKPGGNPSRIGGHSSWPGAGVGLAARVQMFSAVHWDVV